MISIFFAAINDMNIKPYCPPSCYVLDIRPDYSFCSSSSDGTTERFDDLTDFEW